MYKLRLGKSLNFLKENFNELLSEMTELGYDSIDYDLCGKWNERAEDMVGYKLLKDGLEAVKASGLYLNGIHVPFGRSWDFSSTDEAKRAEAVANFAEIAPLIDPYCPGCYVIHGSYEPVAPESREAQKDALKRSLSELMKLTKTTLAVEILPRTCLLNTAAEAIEIVTAMNSDQIRLCVDVNHFLQERSEDGVLKLGSLIVTTHISDHDYENERHWLPGDGKIDWNALIAAFEKIGYSGVFNYESVGTVAEIKANYEKLFANYND